MEHLRQHSRLSVATELWIGQDGIFTRADEKLADLSVGGAFIETSQQYSIGCVLSLRFRMPDASRFLTCTAIVRNSLDGLGFGVQFLDLSPDDRWVLDSYIQKQAAEFSY
jgi:hypothetical protein